MIVTFVECFEKYGHYGVKGTDAPGSIISSRVKNHLVSARSQHPALRQQVRYTAVGIGNALGKGFITRVSVLKSDGDALCGQPCSGIKHMRSDVACREGVPLTFDAVFQPGYTTRKRGWGLGLSLTKRIVENYHNGQIFVKESELDKGTTFRIILKSSITYEPTTNTGIPRNI